ncbi:protein of unknown function [Pseudomonas sp. JV551A1]|uniref:Uncharacterized protein n=1 Tax=Pseudomonas inefficax TaxID=2078786 RepID=A0AAQ1P8J7_9PSED|nr:protein of unknown function [Pseudomonas sp. JV551A1]SPO61824.1 protein of unknown function [Pseudomonas inefficax]
MSATAWRRNLADLSRLYILPLTEAPPLGRALANASQLRFLQASLGLLCSPEWLTHADFLRSFYG